MFRILILNEVAALAREFGRCCREYNSLDFATAWCGDPRHVLPYSYLQTFEGPVRAIVGKSFNQTHPDGIQFLRHLSVDLRIFRDSAGLFHPKLYRFSAGTKQAIFVGSSNLTYSGFYCNEEMSVLLEGVPDPEEEAQVQLLEGQFNVWRSDRFSFVPSDEWMADYRKDFARTLRKEKMLNIKTPCGYEQSIPSASWLRNATWGTYWQKLNEGLRVHRHSLAKYHAVLAAAEERLPLPWRTEYFDELENRRIIGGIGPYGWLGNVAASGRFRQLLARGSQRQRRTIVNAINAIGPLRPPIEWADLRRLLEKLYNLGFTMKVWSRLLCLVSPDLYCTIASPSVRKNLSATLGIAQARFQSPTGYVELLKVIHASPWFQGPVPKNKDEADVWRRRVALMDGIFYE